MRRFGASKNKIGEADIKICLALNSVRVKLKKWMTR
jgi:hypothetical protein